MEKCIAVFQKVEIASSYLSGILTILIFGNGLINFRVYSMRVFWTN